MHRQDEFVRIRRRDTGAHLDYRLAFQTGWSESAYSWRKATAEQVLADAKAGNGPPHFTYGVVEQLEIYPVPVCGVCGAWNPQFSTPDETVHRCWKHEKRNACVIEGCSRSRVTEQTPVDDWWMCSEHWRVFCPPRSPMRRVYHRAWRLGEKKGWPMAARRRFERIWRSIVTRAVQAHSGQFEAFVDEAEINKLFGWD